MHCGMRSCPHKSHLGQRSIKRVERVCFGATWCTRTWRRSARAGRRKTGAPMLLRLKKYSPPRSSPSLPGPHAQAAFQARSRVTGLTNASATQRSRSPQRAAERRGAAVTSNDAQAAQKLLYNLLLNIFLFFSCWELQRRSSCD